MNIGSFGSLRDIPVVVVLIFVGFVWLVLFGVVG